MTHGEPGAATTESRFDKLLGFFHRLRRPAFEVGLLAALSCGIFLIAGYRWAELFAVVGYTPDHDPIVELIAGGALVGLCVTILTIMQGRTTRHSRKTELLRMQHDFKMRELLLQERIERTRLRAQIAVADAKLKASTVIASKRAQAFQAALRQRTHSAEIGHKPEEESLPDLTRLLRDLESFDDEVLLSPDDNVLRSPNSNSDGP